MNYNSNKLDEEKQERNAKIVAIGAIIFAIIGAFIFGYLC